MEKLTSQNRSLAEAYLKRINDKLGLKMYLGGQDTREGINDPELGGYVGHLFPNMSMMYSAIFTAYEIICLREKIDRHKTQELETKAHYWDKWGKDLYQKDKARKQKAFERREKKRLEKSI